LPSRQCELCKLLKRNVIYSLNKIWHREHFTCIRCNCRVGYDGRPFRKCRSNQNYPICIDCYMEEYHPKCGVCKKALRETCVKAMNKLWHRCCFMCTKCHSPFANGMFVIFKGKPYDIDCFYLTKYENEMIQVVNQGSSLTESIATAGIFPSFKICKSSCHFLHF
uniref:LIM zinc-binding domain-containing protein n=1 Tax=Elaeophora elaphi TaxID=1147741 RepID=A0A0R3RGK1_9BILA